MDLKKEIERVRCELGRVIERKESSGRILSLSIELDQLIEQYLEHSTDHIDASKEEKAGRSRKRSSFFIDKKKKGS